MKHGSDKIRIRTSVRKIRILSMFHPWLNLPVFYGTNPAAFSKQRFLPKSTII